MPDDITIGELIQDAHRTAVQKGWWQYDRSMGELLALIHSEVSEALEEYRFGHPIREIRYEEVGDGPAKPVGFPVELADIIIRIADMCGKHGIPLVEALRVKLSFNRHRAYRHGGKRC